MEAFDLSTMLVDVMNHFYGVKMIYLILRLFVKFCRFLTMSLTDSWIQSDLIHDCYTGIFHILF